MKYAAAALFSAGLFSAALAGGDGAVEQKLSYYSDYFSFIGEDGRGKVALALDNNRGRDGDAFQAEHFLVMHDERNGWIALKGNGRYENPKAALEEIPESAFFSFSGSAEKGMVIKSEVNGLALEVSPIPRVLVRERGGAIFWLGSAAATLSWDGRVIRGRVIYEYLHRPGWNRLTRKYFGQWNNFHGLYLSVEGGGDLYLHSQGETKGDDLTGRLVGFAMIDGVAKVLEGITVEAQQSSQALGFYRWPNEWRAQFLLGETQYALEVDTKNRKVISNWVIGGFAMGIVQGELRSGGQKRAIYGLGELII